MRGISMLSHRIEGYDWERKDSGFAVIRAECLGEGRYSFAVEQTDKDTVNPLAVLVSRLSAHRTDRVMYEIVGAEMVGQERLSAPMRDGSRYWLITVTSRDNPDYKEEEDGQEQ